jgi:hypothetical protein
VSVNSGVLLFREVGLEFVEKETCEEQVETTGNEEKDTEKTVHGCVGVGIEIGKAGKGEACNSSQIKTSFIVKSGCKGI